MLRVVSHGGGHDGSYWELHCKKCGVIYDTVDCLPHLIWCVCHLHSVIYYTNGVVSTLHFLQCRMHAASIIIDSNCYKCNLHVCSYVVMTYN